MNIFTFTGHLGKDCEVRVTKGGTTTCEFSVAVYSGYGDNEKTTWASCVIFGKRAEGRLPALLTIGQKVAISGELTQETWEKQNGGTGFKLKVVVDTLDLIGAREQQPVPQSASQMQQPTPEMGLGGARQKYMPSAAGTTVGAGAIDPRTGGGAGQQQDDDFEDLPF